MRFLSARTLACFALSLIAALSVVTGSAQAQDAPKLTDPGSQRLVLAPGPNLVSLYIYPNDLSLDALFADVQDDGFMVKDQDSRVYYPALGIRGVDSWTWAQSHVVYVGDSLSIDLSGRLIDPSTEIILAEGWQQVSFLGREAVPVEEGVASIAASLTTIQDEDGRAYPTAGTGGLLTVLEPGQGYRIRLARADTLAWTPAVAPPPTQEPPPPTPPGDVIRVGTIDEALAIRGLEAGRHVVEVAGYYTPGDGGGGTFDVVASGAAPDGGTVFVPEEHQSDEIIGLGKYDRTRMIPGLPTGSSVVYGSLTLDILTSSDEVYVSIPGEHLHGHRHNNSQPARPIIEYGPGIFRDYATRVYQVADAARPGQRPTSTTLRFRYRHTLSGLRLERRGVGEVLDVTWFGARTERESPGFDNQPVLNHVLNVAFLRNEAAPGSATTVLLPKTEIYGYYGSSEIPDGVTLRGGGGTDLVTVTNDLGHTYRPVRLREIRTTLRVLPGEALRHIRMTKPALDPAFLEPDVKQMLDMRATCISIASGSRFVGLADIEFDGNWRENMEAWTEGWATHDETERWLRNTPGWTGFQGSNHGGRVIPQGQEVNLTNVAIHGYAATGVLGNVNSTWTGTNVLLGDALYNHAFYAANGSYKNLTLFGFSWGHLIWSRGTIENLVFERGAPSPIGRDTEGVVNIRGGDFSIDPEEIAGHGGYTRSDGTVGDLRTEIAGFYIDLRGSGSQRPFDGIGARVTIRGQSATNPGRVLSNSQRSSGFFVESGNGYQDGLYHDNIIRDIVLHESGPGYGTQNIVGDWNVNRSMARNIHREADGARSNAGHAFMLTTIKRDDPAWLSRQSVVYDSISTGPIDFAAMVKVAGDAIGRDAFILNSTIDNRTNTLFRHSRGTGTLSDFSGDPSKLRVYLEDTSFKLLGNYFQNLDLFFAMSRFRGCTDSSSGRTSESTVTIRDSDVNGTEARVPLGLFWAPQDSSYVTISGSAASKVVSWEITNASGAPLGADKRNPYITIRLSESLGGDAVTVDAAVRPWEAGIEIPAWAR